MSSTAPPLAAGVKPGPKATSPNLFPAVIMPFVVVLLAFAGFASNSYSMQKPNHCVSPRSLALLLPSITSHLYFAAIHMQPLAFLANAMY
jgi:hypothetical protein